MMAFKVAATYVGTVVGAGFASGQEVLQFFSVFGSKGFLGLILVTILFIIYGYIIMNLGKLLNSSSHLKIIQHTGGKYLSPIIDSMITFFLFGSLTAMIAGSGAILKQQFNISALWGNVIMAIITAITVLTGIEGVINSISLVVPFLMVAAIGVSISSVFLIPKDYGHIYMSQSNGLVGNWLWAAVLYASYNITLSISVLAPLGNNANNNDTLKKGALLGGLSLGISAFAIYFAISRNLGSIANIEIPMAYIAGRISPLVQVMYIIVLLAEIYTTAVGSLYGFTARLIQSDNQYKKKNTCYNKAIIISTAILALVISRFGFSNLVSYLYPVMGYGGIVLLVSLLNNKFSKL